MFETTLLGLLTLLAAMTGTITGFGLSTVMVPVMTLFTPLPVTLLFVGIIHLVTDIWKVLLFRSGLNWKMILGFGIPGIFASFLGATLALKAQEISLKPILGGFLLIYVGFLFVKKQWTLPQTNTTAISGGLLSGLFAGFFGIGGAVRSAFLTAFNLPKEIYIFTSGMIALCIDISRVGRYLLGGVNLERDLFFTLLICIPISFAGAALAKRLVDRLPQQLFRQVVGVFLALVGIFLLIK